MQQDRRIRLDMVSPLAQMQRRYLMLGSSQQAIAEIAALMQINPQIMDNLNLDQQARNIADAYGLDKRVIYDMADVLRMRQARAQAQQQAMAQAQQLQGLEVGSKALANVSKIPPEMMAQTQEAVR
jgi:septum formation inhibitor-activating ATPase MinD